MPTMIWLGRRWTAGTDEFVTAGFILAVLHAVAAVLIALVLSEALATYPAASGPAITGKDVAGWQWCRSVDWQCGKASADAVALVNDWEPPFAAFCMPTARAATSPTSSPAPPQDPASSTTIVFARLAPWTAAGVSLAVSNAAASAVFAFIAFSSAQGTAVEGAVRNPYRLRVPFLLTVALAGALLVSLVVTPLFAAAPVEVAAVGRTAIRSVAREDLAACASSGRTPAVRAVWSAASVLDSIEMPWWQRQSTIDVAASLLSFAKSEPISHVALDEALSARNAAVAAADGEALVDAAVVLMQSYVDSVCLFTQDGNNSAIVGADVAEALAPLCDIVQGFGACIDHAAPCRAVLAPARAFYSNVATAIGPLVAFEWVLLGAYALLFIVVRFDALGRLTSDVSPEEYHRYWVERLRCSFGLCLGGCCFPALRAKLVGFFQRRFRSGTVAAHRAVLRQYKRRHYETLMDDVALSAVHLFQNLDLTVSDIVAAVVALSHHHNAVRNQSRLLLANHQYTRASLMREVGGASEGGAPSWMPEKQLIPVVRTGGIGVPDWGGRGPAAEVDDAELHIQRAIEADAQDVQLLRDYLVYANAAYGWQHRMFGPREGTKLETAVRLYRASRHDAERVSLTLSANRAAAIDFLGFDPAQSNPHALLTEVGTVITNPVASQEDKAAVLGPTGPSGLLYSSLVGHVLLPAFFVAVDRRRGAIVISIRGTDSVADALTDVVAACEAVDPPRQRAANGSQRQSESPNQSSDSDAAVSSNGTSDAALHEAGQKLTSRTPGNAANTENGAEFTDGRVPAAAAIRKVVGWRQVYRARASSTVTASRTPRQKPELSPLAPTVPPHETPPREDGAGRGTASVEDTPPQCHRRVDSAGVPRDSSAAAASDGPCYCHRGMLRSAQAIIGVLRDVGVLYEIATHVAIRGMPIVVVGHSLGAGTAAILGYLLREMLPSHVLPITTAADQTPFMTMSTSFDGADDKARHHHRRGGHARSAGIGPSRFHVPLDSLGPDEQPFLGRTSVVAYAPPAAVYSRAMASYCMPFTVASAIRDDVVPRVGPTSCGRLRESLANGLVATSEPKTALVCAGCGAMCCCPFSLCYSACVAAQTDTAKGELPRRLTLAADVEALLQRMTRESFEPVGAANAELYPPFRMLHVETASQPRRPTFAFSSSTPSEDVVRATAQAAAAVNGGFTAAGGAGDRDTVRQASDWCAWPLHRLMHVWGAIAEQEGRAPPHRPLRDVVLSGTMVSDHLMACAGEAIPACGLPRVLYAVMASLHKREAELTPLERAQRGVVLSLRRAYDRLHYRPRVDVVVSSAVGVTRGGKSAAPRGPTVIV
jgi:hypothetical protein